MMLGALMTLFLSEKSHAQLLTQDVWITMSDGVRLEATIGRPLGFPPSGGFPAVVLIHGYGGSKNEMSQLMQIVALYGYASLAYSVRGQGNSEGFSTTMGERERQDLFEVINYFRNASNINPNKLAVTGGSQGGIHSWMAAVYRMPGVQAVAPLIATPNFARDLVSNNCVSRWLVFEITLGSVRYGPERDRIKNFIIQDNHDSVLAYVDARNLAHLVDSVRIPVFQAVGWADYLFPVNANIRARAQLAARNIPIWSYYGTNGHGEPVEPVEAAFVLEKVVGWFDHWLKGFSLPDDTVAMVFYSDDRPNWPRHTVREWPPLPNSTVRFYITQNGLSSSLPATSTQLPFSIQYNSSYTPQMGWDDGYGGTAFRNAFQSSSVRLMTLPLSSATEVTGIPRARMFVSSTSEKFQANVKLYDITQTGSGFEWRYMSRGPAGVRGNQPNITRQIDYECTALSHVVPAGHRIGVEITSLDLRAEDAAHIIPYFVSTSSQLLSSSSNASFIEIPVVGSGGATSAEETIALIPQGFILYQNYPNPFNPSTKLSFVIGHSSFANLKVYDVLGREVATLLEGDLAAGDYSIPFDAAGLASGEYFYRLRVGDQIATRKMLLIR